MRRFFFHLRPVCLAPPCAALMLASLISASLPPLASAEAGTQPCPMAGNTYKYRFSEFFRGRASFTADCKYVTIEVSNGPATFRLQPFERGWEALFDTDRTVTTSTSNQGRWEISRSGTQLTFNIAGTELKSRLIPVRD